MKITCRDCEGRGEVAVGTCTCGGIDIGVGVMHEPGCGKEICERCDGTGEIDWPFGTMKQTTVGMDGMAYEVVIPYMPLVVSSAMKDERTYYAFEGKKYDFETLKEIP